MSNKYQEKPEHKGYQTAVEATCDLGKDALAEEDTRLKEELKGGIKNKGEFYERAFKEFKFSKTDTLKHLGVAEADLTDLDGAWKFLVEISNKKP